MSSSLKRNISVAEGVLIVHTKKEPNNRTVEYYTLNKAYQGSTCISPVDSDSNGSHFSGSSGSFPQTIKISFEMPAIPGLQVQASIIDGKGNRLAEKSLGDGVPSNNVAIDREPLNPASKIEIVSEPTTAREPDFVPDTPKTPIIPFLYSDEPFDAAPEPTTATGEAKRQITPVR